MKDSFYERSTELPAFRDVVLYILNLRNGVSGSCNAPLNPRYVSQHVTQKGLTVVNKPIIIGRDEYDFYMGHVDEFEAMKQASDDTTTAKGFERYAKAVGDFYGYPETAVDAFAKQIIERSQMLLTPAEHDQLIESNEAFRVMFPCFNPSREHCAEEVEEWCAPKAEFLRQHFPDLYDKLNDSRHIRIPN